MKKLLGIPAHNEEKYLAHTLSLLSQNHIYKLFDELVIIDDASTDKTLQQAYKQLKKHRPLRNKTSFIIHSKNLGKGAAFIDLIEYAQHHKYQQIFMTDADLKELSYQGLDDLTDSLDNDTIMSILPVYEGTRDAEEPHSIAISGTRGISIDWWIQISNTFGEQYIKHVLADSRFGLEELLNQLTALSLGTSDHVDTIRYDALNKDYYPLARAAYGGSSPNQLQERLHIRDIFAELHKKLS